MNIADIIHPTPGNNNKGDILRTSKKQIKNIEGKVALGEIYLFIYLQCIVAILRHQQSPLPCGELNNVA